MTKFKKEVTYRQNDNDFVIDGEITLKITLNEYRKLVSDQATMQSQIEQANRGKYERETENKKLREENATLKSEMYELKKIVEQNNDISIPDDEQEKENDEQ